MEDNVESDNSLPQSREISPLDLNGSELSGTVTPRASIEPDESPLEETDPADPEPEVSPTDSQPQKRKHAATEDDIESDQAPKEAVQKRHQAINKTRSSSISSGLQSLPPIVGEMLRYKPKSQVIFHDNGKAPDVIISRQDEKDVNFYASHPNNTGDYFIALVEPTNEALASLIHTIKAEIGGPDAPKRMVVTFAAVGDDYVPRHQTEAALAQPTRRPLTAPTNGLQEDRVPPPTVNNFPLGRQPLAPLPTTNSSASVNNTRIQPPPRRPLPTARPPLLPATFRDFRPRVGPRVGTFSTRSHLQEPFGRLNMRPPHPYVRRERNLGPRELPPTASATPSIENFNTAPVPVREARTTTNQQHNNTRSSERQQGAEAQDDDNDVIITHVETRVHPAATPQSQRPPVPRPPSLMSPGSDALTPTSSDRFILQRLQLQWPYKNALGGRLAALGSFTVVHRNILRALHNPDKGTLDENVYSLRHIFTGVERRLFNYLWLQMDTPDRDTTLGLRNETTQLVDEIALHLSLKSRAEFTYERLTHAQNGLLRSLWNIKNMRFYQPEALYRYPILGDAWSDWERLPPEQEMVKRPARVVWDGTGQIGDLFREIFAVRDDVGAFTPGKIKYVCAMPSVIEVHMVSPPPGIPPGRRILEAVGEFRIVDWDIASPSPSSSGGDQRDAGRDTTIVTKEGLYQLMAVVRLRKDEDDRDMVRIYTWGKKCVVPETETCFYPARWSLAEEGREFRLYYVRVETKSISNEWGEEFPGQFRGRAGGRGLL